MLEYLHKQINEILEIDGLNLDENSGEYEVSYKQEPTEEQLFLIRNVIISWPLTRAKLNKVKEIEAWWTSLSKIGWETPYGWNLGLATEDVALLNGIFTLTKEATSLGINDEVFIIDTQGNSHAFNLQDLTMLMLQYGQARSVFSQLYAQRMRDTKEALSIDELEWI
jgi:hypothetical protein